MHKKAQGLSEYALLVAAIAIAAVGIQVYVKRGIQSIVKVTADDLGKSANRYYPMPSQTLGTMETGLVSYNVDTPITTNTQRSSMSAELPESGLMPIRVGTEYSQSEVKGSWTTTYRAESSETFGASEKTKNAPKNALPKDANK